MIFPPPRLTSASARVDDEHSLLHFCEFSIGNELPRLRVQGTVDRDHVGVPEEVVE